MAKVMEFLPKATFLGTPQSGGQDYFSDIFEMVDVGKLTFSLQVFGISATGGPNITGTLQETNDLCFVDGSWFQIGSFSVTGVSFGKQTVSGLRRFVRAKVTMPSGINATLSLKGIGREP
jgi:hypothetical protein